MVERISRLCCFLLASALLSGCALLPLQPTQTERAGWGRLVLVPARFPPHANIRAFAAQEHRLAKGAAAGGGTVLAGVGLYATVGALEAVIAPYLAIVAIPVGVAAGALAADRPALLESDVAALEAEVNGHLATLQFPLTLSRDIAEMISQDTGLRLPVMESAGPDRPGATPDYQAVARQGADSVLEVAVADVGFTGGKTMRLFMLADIRILHAQTGGRAYARRFVYQSDAYEAALWARNEANLLRQELQRARGSIADSAVEQLFLLNGLPSATRTGTAGEAGFLRLLGGRDACGLAWVSPERDYRPGIRDPDHRDWNRFPLVSGAQPTLAWEAFPREGDTRDDAAVALSGVGNVRYDLRIWEDLADGPPRLIYERRGLPGTTHVPEQALPGGRRYFWSVRARFDRAGETHGTQWGRFRYPAYPLEGKVGAEASPASALAAFLPGGPPRDVCTLDFIPTANYYRFRTP